MSELRTNRIIPRDGLPSGSSGGIIQVKQIQHSTAVKYNTNSFTSGVNSDNSTANFSISITPTRSDSKILVSLNSMYDSYAGQRTYVTIFRSVGGGSASNIVGGRGLVEIWNNDHRIQSSLMTQYLDSPNTTSAVTYTVYANTSSGDFYLGLYDNQKWMHAMEVSG